MLPTPVRPLLLLILLAALPLRAAVDCASCHGHHRLDSLPTAKAGRYPSAVEDNAVALMDRGQLGNYGSNFGDMADFHVWSTQALHWPAEADEVTQYGFGLGLFVAARGQVVESVVNSTGGLRDWSPREGSLGSLFSGELRAGDDTPFMAHSHLPDTWPAGAPGPVWPGPWAERYVVPGLSNPLVPTVAMPGQFTSDGDSWSLFDDRLNPRGSLGLEVSQTGYSYGRPYASDHLVWRSIVYNRSSEPLDSVYLGYYVAFRPDFDFVDRITLGSTAGLGLPNGRANDIVTVWDSNNTPDGVWADQDVPFGIPAFVLLESPRNLGVTDFHWFEGLLKPDTEELLHAVVTSDRESLDATRREIYFHGDDRRVCSTDTLLQRERLGDGERLNFVIASGPFRLEAGDSVFSSCAAVLGEAGTEPWRPSMEDLHHNISDLWESFVNHRFGGPGPPPAPVLEGAALPGGVRLWWNPLPSESAEDFQGYRLYRSADRGQSWGTAITDQTGRRVGWVPIAEWDKPDGITGRDPLGYLDLGSDTGLAHAFEDRERIPGLEYWYTLCAYTSGQPPEDGEEGLPSQQNPLGSPLDQNGVAVIPGSRAADREPGMGELLELQPEEGRLCHSRVRVQVLDEEQLRDTDWSLVFHRGDGEDSLRFSLVDLQTGDSLIAGRVLAEEKPVLPMTAGFRLLLEDSPPGVDSLGWNPGSPTTFDWWMAWRSGLVNEYGEEVSGADDWRVLVTEPDQTIDLPSHAVYFGFVDPSPFISTVPIRVERRAPDTVQWQDASAFAGNEDLQLVFGALPQLSPLGWDLVPGGAAGSRARRNWETYSDALLLSDNPDPTTGNGILIKTNNFDWALDADGDTLVGVAPLPGDVFTVTTTKPFRPGLEYRFRTDPPRVRNSADARPAVRAVPDPYIAGNALENGLGARLYFAPVPSRATLRIYTVAGELVRVLEHDDAGSDRLEWDLKNQSRQEVAYGLYLFHLDDHRGGQQDGRFLVIR
jgi:hypothetical protein